MAMSELETWKQDVFDPFCARNDLAHDTIIARLDRLNGWRNKMLGGMALLGAAAPLAIAVWAIIAKG